MNNIAHESIDNQRGFYDEYWRKHAVELNSSEVERLSEILSAIALILPNFKGREINICDLGCGRGWLSAELSKFGNVTAVDLSPEAVHVASQRWSHVNFQAVDILTWRPEKKFDLVVSSEVIEHVPDHRQFADTVSNIIREGGYLVLTTPNLGVKSAWDAGNQGEQPIENWLSIRQVRSLFGQFKVLRHKVFILDFGYNGIFRFISAPKLLKALRVCGFERIYDFVRELLGLGLYQIFVGRLTKPTL